MGRTSDMIRKNSVPQQGIEPRPKCPYPGEHHTAKPPRHLITVTFTTPPPLQGESMSSCILSSEITFATKCNSGSNKLYNPKKFCTSMVNQTPASCYLGKHHTTRPRRHLITVTLRLSTKRAMFCPSPCGRGIVKI